MVNFHVLVSTVNTTSKIRQKICGNENLAKTMLLMARNWNASRR